MENNVERWFKTYNGRKARELYSDGDWGIWNVVGEDSNCEWSGHHYRPNLGTYEGKFIDVVATAVDLLGFWQWGGGGEITRISTTKPCLWVAEQERLLKLKKQYNEIGDQLRKAGMIE